MLAVPPNVIPDLIASASDTLTALFPLIAFTIAVPLTFYVIRRVQSMFPKAKTR